MEDSVMKAKVIVGLIRASGGYKWRKQFKLSDVELDREAKKASAEVYIMRIKLMIAEQLILGPQPLYSDRLKEKYISALTEAGILSVNTKINKKST